MVFDRVVINKLKIIIFVVGIIIGSFCGALVLEKIDNTLESIYSGRQALIWNEYKRFDHREHFTINAIYPFKYELGVNVNIRMYNFDDVQCTVIPSVVYGFVTGMNLQLC